jgi:hypothetical protein
MNIILDFKKKEISAIHNMQETDGHNSKWNNSGTERQILYFFTYMWGIKMSN